ncbi:hypothetical protein ACIA49_27870 [Kribbella sp. NPDC051587]|uniref:hypothetical protein n=1 Tax=Kribbella sp. NPDC051587 TaxID=3364119 RepID=UPI0037B73B55
MPPIKVRDERLLRAAGYRKLDKRGKGSHMVYQNDAQRLANDGVAKPGGKSGAQSRQPSTGRHDPGKTRGSGRGGR